ncbi:hypothetical protein CPCC7001_1534 [Cyanobium sp. PCC 7001]|uniref:hypothetical protein n=1 Tax=Cyanobium sp. PCC 7001 TaxID=180281 RepID=UPI00018052F4|nr:hypothetical protein [Cyanobium sp. PCC 7001]EDY38655.1 hypothetical protein CPCC7001_1534 [Cyanobium sp. PCC 7001]
MTLLLPWLVLALAAGIKLWRLARLVQRLRRPAKADLEGFRGSLEKLWARQEQQA